MLDVRNIHTFYGGSHILQGVSLSVPPGSAVAVLGRNGMGKTTLIRSVVGFTPPRTGEIVFRDRKINHLQPHVIAQMGLGLVPQGRRIFPSLTVEENLQIAARGGGPWTLEAVYDVFPRLRERRRNRGNQLSGGEQQMAAIGRALMTNPALLVLDEPSEGLAPLVVREVTRVLMRLKGDALAILLVEQNLRMAIEIADYVYVLAKGRVVYDGTPAALWADEPRKAEYLGV